MKFDLFFTPPFGRILCDVYHLHEVPVLSRAEPGYVPFFGSRKPFKQDLIFNLPFGFYQTADYFRAAWKADEWQRVKAYAAAHRKNITLTTVGDLGLPAGFHCADNPMLALGDVNDPSAKYTGNLKQNLKKEWNKSRRHAIDVAVSHDPADLRQFYDVLAAQYVREHRMVFQPLSLFSKLLGPAGPGSLVVAKHEGRVVAGLYLLRDGELLHYNWGARTRFANLSLGTLLIDFAVRHAKAIGCTTFDFGSTPLSDSHLLDFKLRWGCDNLPVFKYFTTRPPSQIDLNSSFSTARKVYSALPIRWAAAMMPTVVPWLVS